MAKLESKEFEPWRLRMQEEFERLTDGNKKQFSLGANLDKDYMARLISRGEAMPNVNQFLKICHAMGACPAYVLTGVRFESLRETIAARILSADEDQLKKVKRILDLLDED